MRILFISNYYPPYEFGGYEQLCRDVAVRLAKRGHQIHALTSNSNVPQAAQLDEPEVERSLHLQPSYQFKLGFAAEFFLIRRKEEAHNLDCLRRAIQQFKPDVIFIWNLQRLPRSMALIAEAAPDSAVAYWLAGYTPAEPDEFWTYWSQRSNRSGLKLIKRLFAHSALTQLQAEGKPVRPQMKHVAVVSDYMRQRYIAEGFLPPHAQVIYNGVELDQFYAPVRPADGTLRLLQAGRVSVDKGVHTSVEAVGRLVRDCGVQQIHLHIAGSGPAEYQNRLQHIVAQHHIEDQVTFHGLLPRENLPELMSHCDVLLLPSDHPEAFARVVLEAMAGGLAVVGTLTGGTGELLQEGTTGLTFSPGDSSGLAMQIERLALDPDLLRRIATQGQQMVCKRFSLEHMVDEIEGLLEEVVADRGRS